MPTPRSTTTKPKPAAVKTGRAKSKADAITLLKADHRKVEELFAEYEKATRSDKKQDIANTICDELTIHAALEEKAFYPPAKEVLGKEADLIDEASVEHASLKWLIAQLKSEGPDSDLYDAKVTVLKEYVSHHVKEEEKEMFPKLKKTSLDLVALGEELEALRPELKKKLLTH
jgi:hemerythrin superfamily protein